MGYLLPYGLFTTAFPPQPGDIAFRLLYNDKPNDHHAIVIRAGNGKFDTVDGNSGNDDFKCYSGVWVHKDIDFNKEFIDKNDGVKKKVWVFYRRKSSGGGGGTPPVSPPSGDSTPSR
jgi:hypothetical protein